MIDELLALRSGYFYKIVRPISKRSITDLFRSLRSGQQSVSKNHFHHVKETLPNATWSAISFMYERAPSFLVESTLLRERVGGFMLLVEHADHLCVFKSQLDLPSHFVSEHLAKVAPERIDAGLTSEHSTFERVRLRNMTTSKLALRSKSLEANDLRNAVGPGSSSRFAPLGYTVLTDDDHYSATPRTGRIAQRSNRERHPALAEYACQIINRMRAAAADRSPFLDSFARAIDLSSITARPVSLAIDVALLRTAVLEDREWRFVRT